MPSFNELANDSKLEEVKSFDFKPSAPPFSQCLNKSYSEVLKSCFSPENSCPLPPRQFRSKHQVNNSSNLSSKQINKSSLKANGFRGVIPQDKKTYSIIGTKSSINSNSFKGAIRMFDLYIGNCCEDASSQNLIDYISEECKIKVKSCIELKTKIPDSKAFKISVLDNDRDILLNPDKWPKGIICRKFYKNKSN